MCKHETNSCLLVLVLFVLHILIICSTFVLSTLATQLFVYLFIHLLTAPENLVEHSYQTLHHRLAFTLTQSILSNMEAKIFGYLLKNIPIPAKSNI